MNISSAPDHQKQHKQNGKWNHNGESSNRRLPIWNVFQLAPESPLRKSLEVQHDESSYDSFHNYETDICKDSSDDDYSDANSSHTEGYAVMDVIEYELPDDSESDDVSSASSGTDDFTLEAATAACYEFNALINGHLSDDDDDEFILADTEEDSDGSVDLELGQADYWKCVKCNNRQNNPMYRYCERCYQVRKSLFPPRPRRQKSRAEHNRKRKMAQASQEYSSSEVESESDSQIPMAKKIALSPHAECLSSSSGIGSMNGNQLSSKDKKLNSGNNKHANSAGELSCNNNTSSDDGDDGELTVSSDADHVQHDVVRKIKLSPSSSIEIAKIHVADSSSFSSKTLVKLTPSHVVDNYLEIKLENKIIQNVYRQELIQKRSSPPNSLDWKDSGLSSCQESSQEFSLSPLEDGYLVRSSSSGSTRSFDSQNDFHVSQASTHIQQDSDEETDTEGILTRVEEFTQERQEKMKSESSQSSLLGSRPITLSDSQTEDFLADVNDSNLGLCRFCMVNPKNGVFVHNNCLHLCCCYKCAVKVWKKRKSCPICNCKIKNVTKLFVH